MGRRRKGGRRGGGKQSNRDDRGDEYVSTIVARGNPKMEVYYAAQGLYNTRWKGDQLVACSNDAEKQAERSLWRSIATRVLPASFRIAKDVPASLRETMEAELESMLENSRKDGQGEVITKLQFLPHAFQLQVDRTTIRKNPNLAQLHEWLKQQTLAGYITRQETVSMVPPVVLAPQPADHVLDMCAAPGSKTTQILEDLGPAGCVVANDANGQRAHMLVTQLRRITHLNPVAIVTSCEGQFFPAVTQLDRILCDVPCSGDGTSRKNLGIWKTWSQMSALALHRLQLAIAWKGASQLLKVGGYMCYSTCSYNPMENEAVVAELLRLSGGCLQLEECKLEGFKTRPGWSHWKVFCEDKTQRESKNMEKKHNDKMKAKRKEFEEKDQKDEELVCGEAQKGLSHDTNGKSEEASGEAVEQDDDAAMSQDTTVAETAGKEQASIQQDPPNAAAAKNFQPFEPESMDEDELIEMAKAIGFHYFTSVDQVPENLNRRVVPSCFPPTLEEAKRFHLERTIRCLPQDNDTGGFFVALLKKTGEISSTDRRFSANASNEKEQSEPAPKRSKVEQPGVVDGEEKDEVDDESNEDDDLVVAVDDDNKPIRGAGNNTRDGKNHPEVGKEDFIPVDDSILDPLLDLFGLKESNFEKDLIMTRNSGKSKVLYYIARPIKDLIDQGLQDRVTVVNTGLKAFSRSTLEGEAIYRVCQEAANFLAPYMTKRKFVVGIDDFLKCLTEERYVAIETLSEPLRTKVRELSVGSLIVVLDGYEDQFDQKMVATLWRCRTDRLDSLVAKVEIKAIKTKLNSIRGKTDETEK